MFRAQRSLGTARKYQNWSRFHHNSSALSYAIPTTAAALAVTYSYTNYTAHCDAIPVLQPVISPKEIPKIVVSTLTPEALTDDPSLWSQFISGAQETFNYLERSARYMERVLTYLVLGLPLAGLVPASCLFGSAVPQVEEMTWNYLVWAVQTLGPCFIKLAQWASTRPDLFPPKLIERIEKFQDDVKVSYPSSVVEETLQTAFGDDWRTKLILEEKEMKKPLGTGSVAQVFKGYVLKTGRGQGHGQGEGEKGEAVAIKMIHPHVEELVKTDMELLTLFANLIDCLPSLEILSIGETCRQFADTMNQQLDLRLEASHLKNFAKKFAQETWAVFPQPIEGLVTKNVLVESLMEGTPISYFMNLPSSSDIDSSVHRLKMKLSDLGCRLILKMVFFDNYIHGDLHPGNVLVQIMPNGDPRLIILDCGIVYSSQTDAEHEKLVDICFAFMQHDGHRAGHLLIDNANEKVEKQRARFQTTQQQQQQHLSAKQQQKGQEKGLVKGSSNSSSDSKSGDSNSVEAYSGNRIYQFVNNEEGFCKSMQAMIDASEEQSVFEHISEYVAQICELARVHLVRLDPGYFKIAMALKVAEGISLALNRDLDLVSKCIPIIMKTRAMRKMGLQEFPMPENDDEFMQTTPIPKRK